MNQQLSEKTDAFFGMNTAQFGVRPMTLPSHISRFVSASLLALMVLLFASTAVADTNAPSPAADRYLFIVETSSAMKKRTDNTAAFVGHKVTTGLDGHMRPGATVGVWTFDDALSTGKVPLQRWSGENGQKAAVQITDYLRKQTSDKAPKLAQPVQAMNELIKKSDRITILLITSGEEKINGTPYDADINAAFKENGGEQKKKKMPFVTVLRAVKGEYVGFRVSTPPWPVELPPFPSVTNVARPPTKAAPPAAPPPTAPPKSLQTNTPTHANIAAPEAHAAPATAIPQPEKVAVESPKPVPAEALAATLPQPSANATPTTIPQPTANTPSAPVVNIPQPNLAPPADLAPATPPKVESAAPVVAETRTSLVPQPTPAKPAELKQPQVAPPPSVTPPPPSTPETKSEPAKPVATNPQSVPASQAIVIPSAGSSLKKMTLLVGGGALIVGAAIFFMAQMRRPRKIEKISLITHAVERKD